MQIKKRRMIWNIKSRENERSLKTIEIDKMRSQWCKLYMWSVVATIRNYRKMRNSVSCGKHCGQISFANWLYFAYIFVVSLSGKGRGLLASSNVQSCLLPVVRFIYRPSVLPTLNAFDRNDLWVYNSLLIAGGKAKIERGELSLGRGEIYKYE